MPPNEANIYLAGIIIVSWMIGLLTRDIVVEVKRIIQEWSS